MPVQPFERRYIHAAGLRKGRGVWLLEPQEDDGNAWFAYSKKNNDFWDLNLRNYTYVRREKDDHVNDTVGYDDIDAEVDQGIFGANQV